LRRLLIELTVLVSQSADALSSWLGFRAGNTELNPWVHNGLELLAVKFWALVVLLVVIRLAYEVPRIWTPVALAAVLASLVLAAVAIHNLVIA
jgi:hypothetical protein